MVRCRIWHAGIGLADEDMLLGQTHEHVLIGQAHEHVLIGQAHEHTLYLDMPNKAVWGS